MVDVINPCPKPSSAEQQCAPGGTAALRGNLLKTWLIQARYKCNFFSYSNSSSLRNEIPQNILKLKPQIYNKKVWALINLYFLDHDYILGKY